MSDTYKKANQGQFDDSGKGMKTKKNKSLGIEDSSSGQDESYDPDKDYEAKSDADTLHKASEIKNDPDRHEKAAYHLGKRADAAKDAHKEARKQLEKKTKGRLKKTFGGGKGGGAGGFQNEADKERGETESIVHENE